jgi:HK97 gp10 family phage protein
LSVPVKIAVSDTRELIMGLKEHFPTALTNGIENSMQRVSQSMYEEATRLVPVRTGYLRSTIAIEPGGKWILKVVARASYAAYVEWGTSRMAPRLFMTRAVEIHGREMREEIVNAVQDAIIDTFR